MKPRDRIEVTYPNGAKQAWTVSAVLLGGLGEESVIELEPIGVRPNGHGRTLCPAAMLYALSEGGSIVVREYHESDRYR